MMGGASTGTAEWFGCFRFDSRKLLLFFMAISALYGFWLIYDMDHYLPWKVRFLRGVELTFIGHFALGLAAFDWRSRWRFLVAAMLFPTLIGVAILWWHIHLIAAFAVLAWLARHMVQIMRGAPRGD